MSDTAIAAGPLHAGKTEDTIWGFSRAQFGALAVMVVFLAVAPFVLYPVFLMKLLCFALFALAFNLLIGYVGLLSFGHAAYFGMGGYIGGHLAKAVGLSPELAILGGAVVSAALGAAFGWVAIRRQGIYFAMITLALAQLVFFVFVQAPFTGGENGLQGVPRGHLFGLVDMKNNMAMYYFVLAVFVLGFAIIQRTIHSPYGQVLKAIRENEPRAVSLGYNVDRHKLLAFVISAALAGLAGCLSAHVSSFIGPNEYGFEPAVTILSFALLGGIGNPVAPVFGAWVLTLLPELLRGLADVRLVVNGLIIVVAVLFLPRGLFGVPMRRVAARLRARLGPWAVSGPAIAIGSAALADGGWAARMRERLKNDARRLDGLLRSSGLRPRGGTALFLLAEGPDDLFDRLGRRGILVRSFPERPGFFRFGLPRDERAWTRLAAALRPSWASEITGLTPRRPRRARERKNSVQKCSASELPVVIPSTSRRPSVLTATATITAPETMRWSRRALT